MWDTFKNLYLSLNIRKYEKVDKLKNGSQCCSRKQGSKDSRVYVDQSSAFVQCWKWYKSVQCSYDQETTLKTDFGGEEDVINLF